MAQNERKSKKIAMPQPQQVQAPAHPTRTPEQEKEARFQVFAQQWFNENLYTPQDLHPDFYKWKEDSFSHFSDAGLKMALSQYVETVSALDHTYTQFNVVLQILYMVNAHQLGISMERYITVFKPEYKKMSDAFTIALEDAKAQQRIEFDALEAVMDTTTEVAEA